ncbi:aspartyl protease family protein [Brevundimonas sp.]|uniref:aspartyl protease family protein n=1 Tax=Brevundimonas sp. TaxID=1871086 RepID=UPI003BABA7E2
MVTRRTLMVAAAAIAAAPCPAFARQVSFDSLGSHRGRATVPVRLNGQGPFTFMVDTAANASVIADDLVAPLRLELLGNIGMHTLIGREIVPAVRANHMQSGTLDAPDVRLAVGQRLAMGGLDGLLGCDLLVGRKIILNFQGSQRVRIARSAAPARGFHGGVTPGIPLVVTGERRFGNLLIVPARINRISAMAIIDSGAEGTILNRAAALAGNATPLLPRDGQDLRRIQSPTGEVTTGQAMLLPSMNFAGIGLRNLPVAVGDFHSFRFWGLEDEPAMLIGLDILRMFKSVHIDLGRNELMLHV